MKYSLMASAAALALVTGTAFAQEAEPGSYDGESGLEVDFRYANNIDTSVTTDVTYTKDVALRGGARLVGTVNVDSSAVAVNDVKQIQGGVAVRYREENELNGENGYVDPVFGPGWSEAGDDPNDLLTDGVKEDQIRAGYFAPIINTIDGFDVSGAGNIGVNLAAGYFNEQLNSAVIATSANADPEAAGGWAEASTTSLQSLIGVSHWATEGEILPEDDPEEGGAFNNFRDRNTITAGSVSGAGNIGLNAAAGALNQQANLLTIAVANDSTLAEANAGIIQTALLSGVEQQDSINMLTGPTVSGEGNVGVNLAVGVGNQQLNSLTIASSQSAGGGGGTGGGGGDGS